MAKTKATPTVRYVVECRMPDGRLDGQGRQPEQVFGVQAHSGITADEMAKRLMRYVPAEQLHGDRITQWPSLYDPRWVARVKTW